MYAISDFALAKAAEETRLTARPQGRRPAAGSKGSNELIPILFFADRIVWMKAAPKEAAFARYTEVARAGSTPDGIRM